MYSETQGSLNLQYTNENLYYIEFSSCPSYSANTTTYFMSNTQLRRIRSIQNHNITGKHEKSQSRSGSEVHLRKLITHLRFSRFKKSNEFGLSSYQGSRSGFFIRSSVQIGLLERTSFQLSLTLGRGRYICYILIYVDNLKELLIIHQGWYPHKLLDTD